MPAWLLTLGLISALSVATITDIRSRTVPAG